MQGIEVIRRLREHQRWSTQRLFEAAAKLSDEQLQRPFEMGPGSLFKLLAHLVDAESLWLQAIEGNPNPPWPAPLPSLAEVTAAWAALDRRWAKHFAQWTDDDLQRDVLKANSREPTRKLATSLSDVLLHVATHAHYHAAQARNMLRHLNVAPLPDVMLISMSRAEHAARE